MLIAPTESPQLKALGKSSPVPEQWGCDIVVHANGQWAGIQRKAIPDLIASLHDDRLTRELIQMDACNRLDVKILVVEGEPIWTNEGVLMTNGYGEPFRKTQWYGLLWSVRLRGIWVERTADLADTIRWVQMFDKWWAKEKHTSLVRRSNSRGVWGSPSNREFGMHMLMGIPGIGPELAGAIYDTFGGIPWTWTVSEKELMAIRGVGKKKAAAMIAALTTPAG